MNVQALLVFLAFAIPFTALIGGLSGNGVQKRERRQRR